MLEFQLLDEKRYPLNVDIHERDLLPYYRWEHRATIGYNTKEYIIFLDNLDSNIYCEQLVGGHLEVINDDSFFDAIIRFATEKGLLQMIPPIMKPSHLRII